MSDLTKRQLQVFQLIADGKRAKQVAGDLKLDQRTVAQHLKNGRKALGSMSTPGAVAALMRKGEIR